MHYDETAKTFRIYLPSQRKVLVRRDVKFEEERAFMKSRESKQGEQQVPAPQVVSQVFRVTRPHNVGIGSLGSLVKPAGSSGTGDGSTITCTPYRGLGSRL